MVYDQTQTIECGGILAGFRLVLADLFGELDQTLGKPKNAMTAYRCPTPKRAPDARALARWSRP